MIHVLLEKKIPFYKIEIYVKNKTEANTKTCATALLKYVNHSW